MRGRGRAVSAVGIALALAVPAACGGGASTGAGSTSSVAGTTEPVGTLGLTPLPGETTIPLTTFDTIPSFETDDTEPFATDEPTTSTTLYQATSLDPVDDTLPAGSTLPDPEPPPLPEAHENRGQLGYLEIPALGVAQGLFEGVTLTTLNAGPGHWPGSAMPGQVGNVVVAGHRVSHTHPFRDLDKLEQGDQIVFSTAQGRNVYVVTKTQIVNPDALWIVDQTTDKTATLFACHPKGSTAQRIVVHLRYAPELSQPAA